MSKLYEVTFYREVVGDQGRCKNVPIQVIRARGANADQAAVKAQHEFQKAKKCLRWDTVATHFEVKEGREGN
jgi:hypothetical protein